MDELPTGGNDCAAVVAQRKLVSTVFLPESPYGTEFSR